MKKAFAILLAICMMIPVFAVSTFAVDNSEATEIDNTIPTVYVASTGSDATTDGTNRDTPFKSFEAAYNDVISTKHTGETRKVVLIDDVVAFDNNKTTIHPLKEFSGTVYVCGEYNGNSYSTLDCSRAPGEDAAGCVIILGANMVFYDITLKNASSQLIWFVAAWYDLTLGFNITHNCKSVPITGSVWNGSNTQYCDDRTDGATISIYSGDKYGTVIAGNRSNLGFKKEEKITLNVYAGKYSSISSREAGSNADATIEINIYGIGKSTTVKAPDIDNSKDKLNLYNGVEVTLSDLFADKTNVTEGLIENKFTAPSYAVNYCGVQDKSEGEKFSVRLVGTVDSLDFDYVGFEIDLNGMDYSNTSKRVYTSIQGADKEYTAAQLGSNYIYTRTITGIPKTGTMTFTVRPFIRIGDVASGVNYYGNTYEVTYVDGVLQK